MADKPPSKRRIRRIATLIAGVVLLIGVGWWWLTRPQLDPRLVGRWRVEMGGHWITGHYEYREDGNGVFLRSGTPPAPFSWEVSGKRLIVTWPLSLQERLGEKYDSIRARLRGRKPKCSWGDNVEIVQISQNDIQLLDVSFWPMKMPVHLRRLEDDSSKAISD
jgi:hypothetical protein